MDDASIPSMVSSITALRTSALSRFRRAVNVLNTRCANRGSIDETPRSMICTFPFISCSSVGFGGGASSFFSVFFSSVLFISTSCIVNSCPGGRGQMRADASVQIEWGRRTLQRAKGSEVHGDRETPSTHLRIYTANSTLRPGPPQAGPVLSFVSAAFASGAIPALPAAGTFEIGRGLARSASKTLCECSVFRTNPPPYLRLITDSTTCTIFYTFISIQDTLRTVSCSHLIDHKVQIGRSDNRPIEQRPLVVDPTNPPTSSFHHHHELHKLLLVPL